MNTGMKAAWQFSRNLSRIQSERSEINQRMGLLQVFVHRDCVHPPHKHMQYI